MKSLFPMDRHPNTPPSGLISALAPAAGDPALGSCFSGKAGAWKGLAKLHQPLLFRVAGSYSNWSFSLVLLFVSQWKAKLFFSCKEDSSVLHLCLSWVSLKQIEIHWRDKSGGEVPLPCKFIQPMTERDKTRDKVIQISLTPYIWVQLKCLNSLLLLYVLPSLQLALKWTIPSIFLLFNLLKSIQFVLNLHLLLLIK